VLAPFVPGTSKTPTDCGALQHLQRLQSSMHFWRLELHCAAHQGHHSPIFNSNFSHTHSFSLGPRNNLEGSQLTVDAALKMDVTDITPQLEQLDVDLDVLEEALRPLLGDISDISSRLPLLDKAKLNVLISYAIESVLFCKPRTKILLPLSQFGDTITNLGV